MSAPQLPEKPLYAKLYSCLNSHLGNNPDELTFVEGDILVNEYDKIEEDNFIMRLKDKTGKVPVSLLNDKIEELPSIFHEASKRGDMETFNKCIAYQCPVNMVDGSGSTPLHWAATFGHEVCASILIKTPGAKLNIKNKMGDTPLHCAGIKGHAKIAELLIEAGADTNITNKDGKTALSISHNPHVKMLLTPRPKSINDNDYFIDKEEKISEEKSTNEIAS